ncbi:hypothetical protein [Pseudomonas sp. Marseille-Q5115]|nr:hypothetical protein [Pseudomonas sp. Marseille-Q5115]
MAGRRFILGENVPSFGGKSQIEVTEPDAGHKAARNQGVNLHNPAAADD